MKTCLRDHASCTSADIEAARRRLYVSDWLVASSANRWRTTHHRDFNTRYGIVGIGADYVTNLFTGVPNTPYAMFWDAAALHDFTREQVANKVEDRVVKTRRQSDDIFLDEMQIQSAKIMLDLQLVFGTDFAVSEYRKLLRLSRVYYWGVSGPLGSLYLILSRLNMF